MTHVSQRRIFQSGDFRLTDPRTGQEIDYWAQKQIIVQRFKWTALIGFCGIAHTGREYVPEWIAQQLRELAPDAPFDALEARLCSAETWLASADPRYREITFSLGAFVEFKPTFVLISNVEAIGRPPTLRPAGVPASLTVTRFRPRNQQLFLAGRKDAVLPRERQSLRGTFRKERPPDQAYAALAEINRKASERDDAVGPACFTAHATVLGEHGGTVHGWPADRDFMPAFLDIEGHMLPRLKRRIDEHGRPQPIQVGGVAGGRSESSREYFRVALEEKPDDPSILSNYGNWLKDRGEWDEAEAAYRKAIESDDKFASAHGNLANLLKGRGDLTAAEREYRRAVELDENSVIDAANLAFFLWERHGERRTGKELLASAVTRQRDVFTVGRLALFTELALGDPSTARQLYEEALRLEPEDPWLNGRLAQFYNSAGETESALAYFERAVAGDRPDPEALLRYAELNVRSGSPRAAVDLLRRALKQHPRNPTALAMLAATQTVLGGPEADIERMYRQVLDWDPCHPLAALNLAQLLLRRGGAAEEARNLLLAAEGTKSTPEFRLELLFYGLAYDVPGFENAAPEIRALTQQGVRVCPTGT
jgi:tetratricopeptide (TPR) repeat protein